MSADLALDFGSSMTRVAEPDGSVVLEEPTVAAIDVATGGLVAFGRAALGLGALSAGRVRVRRVVRAGQLLDLDVAELALGDVLRRTGASRLSHPRVLVTLHVGATAVQRRAIERALRRGGARAVHFLEQPLAAAIGAGLAIDRPLGQMVVDVGGGTTDIAVVALGGVVTSECIALGGDDFDETVRAHLTRRHDLVVDHKTAHAARRSIGSVRVQVDRTSFEIHGRHARTGALCCVELHRDELGFVLSDLVRPILTSATRAMTSAPPDLANDLLGEGLILCGGGASLDGFDEQLAQATGIPVHVSIDAGRLPVLGAARCLRAGESSLALSATLGR